MANEFIARKGLIVSGSTKITGSLNVSGGITGSLLGTGSWAQNVVSASYASTASYALNLAELPLAIETNTFTGDGNTINFTLTEPYDLTSIIVSVDGLTYTQTIDYGVSGTTLTFVSAPPSQSNILVRAFVNYVEGTYGTIAGNLLGTASYAETASVATKIAVYTGSVTLLSTQYTGSFTGSFTGDGSQLTGVGNINVTGSAPSGPENGELWFDDTTGKTYIYYVSASVGSWILQSDPTYDPGLIVEAATASLALAIPTFAPATPVTGSIYFAGNYLYVYTGTQYKSASLN